MPLQYDLFGGAVIAGNIVDRIEWLLETYPDARDDYTVLIIRYWLEFDGLADLVDEEAILEWARQRVTAPKTLQNRAMEIQRRRPDLDARPEVREWRNRQAKAGVVR